MRGLDDVVRALGALRVAGEAPARAEPGEVLAAGEQLVHVGLVPGVEDDRVVRRVEDPVDRDRQLDDAEVRPEVAAGPRHVLDEELADLGRELGRAAPTVSASRSRGLEIDVSRAIQAPFAAPCSEPCRVYRARRSDEAGRSAKRPDPFGSTDASDERAQHVLQDAAVAVVVGLTGGVDADDRVELDRRLACGARTRSGSR